MHLLKGAQQSHPSLSSFMKKTSKAFSPANIRWFLLMNIVIAIVLVCAALILDRKTSDYNSQSNIDRGYLRQTKSETNTETLQHGIIYTEAARATAARSAHYISNGASISWGLVALTLVMNSLFIFRMSRNHQVTLSKLTSV